MKSVCLIVLDGWGIAPPGPGNAISIAQPRHILTLMQDYPHTLLDAAGSSVGLLPGYIGNSQVGHLHLGAGRLVRHDLVRILDDIKSRKFFRNPVLRRAMQRKRVHLLGLVSDAGVHSHIAHLFALLALAEQQKVPEVYVHAITDGRDVPPKSAQKYLAQVQKHLGKNACIATITGRYYAMDRDNRWNRQKKAYEALVNGKGKKAESAEAAIQEAYARNETDEFIQPTVLIPEGTIREGDAVVFFNFRSDRARELTRAFVQDNFKKFRRKKIRNLLFATLTQYESAVKTPVAYPSQDIANTLGEMIAKSKLRQFRLAETEKWAHVTYFFNGLSDKKFPGEDRTLIPSPKIPAYDQKPEMSALGITKKAIAVLQSKKYGFVLVNFANPDMVGHTGNSEATVKAIRTVDECVAHIVNAAMHSGTDVIITGDHGNAEQTRYPDGTPCTAHTTNKVLFILVSEEKKRLRKLKKPCLYHVAPTVLQLLGLERPEEMEPGLLR